MPRPKSRQTGRKDPSGGPHDPPGDTIWANGSEALLVGLSSRPELNGQRVHVAAPGEGGRVCVRLGDGECISVKPERLMVPPAPMEPMPPVAAGPEAEGVEEVEVLRDAKWRPTEASDGGAPIRFAVADLPPFDVRPGTIAQTNGVSSALDWAFTCAIPPLARVAFRGGRGAADAGPTAPAPALQWLYSMWHVAKHYENGHRRFQIQDDEQTESLLLEVTDLRACPKGLGLARADFCAPRASAPLGAPPLFAVRYLHQTKATLDVASVRPGGAVHEWVQRAGGAGVMLVRAASSAEVRHGKEVLEAGRRYIAGPVPGSPAKPGAQFRDSVLFPPPLADMQRAMAAQPALKVCAFCGIHKDKLQRCSRCTVTYYCSHKCQKADWKAGHKAACTAAADVIYGGPASASQAPGAGAGDRPSFVFDVLQNDARKFAPVASVMNFNTGTVTTTADPKAMGSSGIACDKMQKPKNVHGNAEFIVKLQPPVQGCGPWMCYDKQRSFTAQIPPETAGLPAARRLLEKDGIRLPFPMNPSLYGFKGYCYAAFEGSRVRVFVDKLAPQQQW